MYLQTSRKPYAARLSGSAWENPSVKFPNDFGKIWSNEIWAVSVADGGFNVAGKPRITIARWMCDNCNGRGWLTPGRSYTWTWSRNDKPVASIEMRTEGDQVVLSYRHRSGGGDWASEEYPVRLDWTTCRYSGRRTWFLCPAKGCGRRVALLYGGAIFACRHCYRMAYPSQRESGHDRAARRADKICAQLGWTPGILNPVGDRPKGMHLRTFERLSARHDAYAHQSFAGMMALFERWNRRLGVLQGEPPDDGR